MRDPNKVPADARPALAEALARTTCPVCAQVGTIVLEDVTRPVLGALTMRTRTVTYARCTTTGCPMRALTWRNDDE